jgi:hypothetical protein
MNWYSSQTQPSQPEMQPPQQSSSNQPSTVVQQKKDADLLKQCIMQCIVAKNAADRAKNYWTGTSNASQREAQIRQVLNDILNTPNLSQVMVVDHIASTVKTGLSKMKQATSYGYNSLRARYQKSSTPTTQSQGTMQGGKTRRRRHYRHKRSSK